MEEHHWLSKVLGVSTSGIGNCFIWTADLLNGEAFGSVLKLLGFVSLVLSIANALDMLGPVKRKLRAMVGIKGKQ